MKKVFALTALLSLGVSQLAIAQTMDNTTNSTTSATTGNPAMGSPAMGNSATTGMAPSANMPGMTGSSNAAPGAMAPSTMTTATTGMPSTGSMATTTPAGSSAVTNTQATIMPKPGSGTTVPTMSGQAAGNQPLQGANSFTEKQVERRLKKDGYTSIAGLAKDDSGVWRGTAVNKSKQSVSIALDYKGRVTETQ